ncbi:twin-arginine translocase TatA/TatE family subunit [Robertmurraya yapensis]|uniref:Sec-independent protein translocase protein TatA n=2 Tax=Bacillaceae TaxID=186817 RepID=A0A431VYZ0_9BACI|nr:MULTISPECIES: twin-arginine translocase TatA/TatE family subunit [Bacillaceae]RTR28119.1 twin-arginine translocase TatA/TatE family subunit [Bacillus yapensis]TKC15159.1 twin-arginine translocase TatA/TatE family subunit [Robertmurraya kyonggiensis]TKS94362.1 twin-arginine translocase TatA/TatE family subunit [Bacillus yapensis]
MLGQIGIPGIIILLVICLIAFGSKNLPNIGRSLGESLQEFKRGISGLKEGIQLKENENSQQTRSAISEERKEL